MHLDLDAFFASVEENLNPSLKNVPFVISDNSKSSIISTSNYIARKYNVKSAMQVGEALELCKNLRIVNPNYDLYSEYSTSFFNLLREHFNFRIETMSIDECFIDVTQHLKQHHDNPILLATKIKEVVKKRLGLSLSIGIANTKYLAKIASDLKKPNSINTLFKEEIETKIYNLEVSKLLYLGKKSIKSLNDENIFYVKDLLNDLSKSTNILGNKFLKILSELKGQGSNIIEPDSINKQVGISHRFSNLQISFEIVEEKLFEIINVLLYKTKDKNLFYETINVYFKNENNKTINKSKKIHLYDNIFDVASYLLSVSLKKNKVQLIGVAFSNPINKSSIIY